MRPILFICFLFLQTYTLAQNLVLNPSFEEFNNCPDKFTTEFRNVIVPNWESPSSGTPDYYNTCSDGLADVPKNWATDCEPVSGSAYAGIYAWKKGGFREYLQGQLKEPLKKGDIYTVGFYVHQSLNAHLLIGSIGALLTVNPILSKKFDYDFQVEESSVKPDKFRASQVLNKEKKHGFQISPNNGFYLKSELIVIPSEMTQWQKVQWNYTAAGGERFLVIGNFNAQSETVLKKTKYRLREEPMLKNSAYLLIDDVFVYPENYVAETPPKTEEKPFVLSDVNFEYNRDELSDVGMSMLDSLLSYLQQKKSNYELLIVGHTDDSGSHKFNMELGMKRAESVASHLIFNGEDEQIIRIESAGENQPLDTNNTELGRRKNRRVEITIVSFPDQ